MNSQHAEKLNTANKSYFEVHENRGDMEDINLIQTKSKEESIKDILVKHAVENPLLNGEIISQPSNNIIQSNLERANPLKQKSSKIPIFMKSSKFRKNGGSGENYFRNLVQSKPYADIITGDMDNLQKSNQNREDDPTESLSNDSSQIEYYSELCNFHLPRVNEKPDKFYYCKNSCLQNSNNVNDNNYSTNQPFKQNKHQSDFQRKFLMSKKFEFSFRCLKDIFVYKFNNYIKSHFNSSKLIESLPKHSTNKTKSYDPFGHSESNRVSRSKDFILKARVLSHISNSIKEIKPFLDLIINANSVIENFHQNLSEVSIKLSVVKFEKCFVMPIQTPFHFYNKHLFNSNNRYKILKNSKLFGMYCLGSSNDLAKPNLKLLDEIYRFRQGKITGNYLRSIEKHKIVSKVKLNFSNFHSKDLSNSLENISSISTSLMDLKNLTKTKSVDYLNTKPFQETLKLEGLNLPSKCNSMNRILANNDKDKALVEEMNSNRIPPNSKNNPFETGNISELNDANPKLLQNHKNTFNINLHSEIKLIATVTGKKETNPKEINAEAFKYNFKNDKSSEIVLGFQNEMDSLDNTIIITSPFKSEIEVLDENPQIKKFPPINKEEFPLRPSKISTNSGKRFSKRKLSNSNKAILVDVKDSKVSHLKVNKTPSDGNSFTKPIPFLYKRERSDSTIGPYYEIMSETAPFENYASIEYLNKVPYKVKPNKTTNSKSKIHPKVNEIRKDSKGSFSTHQASNVKIQKNLKKILHDYECHVNSHWELTNIPNEANNFSSSITAGVNILINQLKDSNRFQEKFDKKLDKENLPLDKMEPRLFNHRRSSDHNGKFDFPKRLSLILAETDDRPIKLQELKVFSPIETIDKPEINQELKHNSVNRQESKSDSNCECGDRYSKVNENCTIVMKNLVLCKRNELNQVECSKDLCCCVLCLDNSGNISKPTMETYQCQTCCCCQCPRHKMMMPKYYCATVSRGNLQSCNNIISLKNFGNSNAVTNLILNSNKDYRIENIELNNNNINYLLSNQVFYHDPRSNRNFNFSQNLPVGEIRRKIENPVKNFPCYGSSIYVPLRKINHYCESRPRNRLERINFVRRKINLSKLTNIIDMPAVALNFSTSKGLTNSTVLESFIDENSELIDNNSITHSSFGLPIINSKTPSADKELYQSISRTISIVKSKSFELSSLKYPSNPRFNSYAKNQNVIDIEKNRNLDGSVISENRNVNKNMEIRPSLTSMSDLHASHFEKFLVTSSQTHESPKKEPLEINEKKVSLDNEYERNELKSYENNETLPKNKFSPGDSSEIDGKYHLPDSMTTHSNELYNIDYENHSVSMEPINSSLHEDYQGLMGSTENTEGGNLQGFGIDGKSGHTSKSPVNIDENTTAQKSSSKYSNISSGNKSPVNLSHHDDPSPNLRDSLSLSDEKYITYSDDFVDNEAEKQSNSDSTTPSENYVFNPNGKVSSQYSDISVDKGSKHSFIDNSSISIQNNIPIPNLLISSKSSNKTKELITLIPSPNAVNKYSLMKENSTISPERYDTNPNIRKSLTSSTESNEISYSRNSQLSKNKKVQPSSFQEASGTSSQKYDANLIKNLSLNKKDLKSPTSSKTSTIEKFPVNDKISSRSSKLPTSGKLEKSPVNAKISSRSSKSSTSGKLEKSTVNDKISSRSSKLSTSGKNEKSPIYALSGKSSQSIPENYKITSNKTKSKSSRETSKSDRISGLPLTKSNSSQKLSKHSSTNIQSTDKMPLKSSQIYKDSQLYYLPADTMNESPLNKQKVQPIPSINSQTYLPEQVKDRNPSKPSQSYDSQHPIVSNNLDIYKPNSIEADPKLNSSSTHKKSRHRKKSLNTSESINNMTSQKQASQPQSFHETHHDLNKQDQMVSKSTQKYESANVQDDNKNVIKSIDTSRVDKIFDKLLHYSTMKRESRDNNALGNLNLAPSFHNQSVFKNRTSNNDLSHKPSLSNEPKDKNPSNSFHKYSLSNNSVLDHPFSVSVTSLNFNDLMNTTPVFAKNDSSTNKLEKTFETNGKGNSRFSDKLNSPKSTDLDIANTPECFDQESQKKCSVPSIMTVKNTSYMTAKDETEKNGKLKDDVSLNLNLLQIPYQNFRSSSTESLLKNNNINNLNRIPIEFHPFELGLMGNLNKRNINNYGDF